MSRRINGGLGWRASDLTSSSSSLSETGTSRITCKTCVAQSRQALRDAEYEQGAHSAPAWPHRSRPTRGASQQRCQEVSLRRSHAG
jgi:hypothetical protein